MAIGFTLIDTNTDDGTDGDTDENTDENTDEHSDGDAEGWSYVFWSRLRLTFRITEKTIGIFVYAIYMFQ